MLGIGCNHFLGRGEQMDEDAVEALREEIPQQLVLLRAAGSGGAVQVGVVRLFFFLGGGGGLLLHRSRRALRGVEDVPHQEQEAVDDVTVLFQQSFLSFTKRIGQFRPIKLGLSKNYNGDGTLSMV